MIQVSMGRRSRSPLSPLSLRITSRADLTMLRRRAAVVLGVGGRLRGKKTVLSVVNPGIGNPWLTMRSALRRWEPFPSRGRASSLAMA